MAGMIAVRWLILRAHLQRDSAVLVHVLELAAYKGFVNLKLATIAAHLLPRAVLEGETDAVQHEPRGLLSDLQIAGNLVAADAVLAVHYQPDRHEPLVESDGRLF